MPAGVLNGLNRNFLSVSGKPVVSRCGICITPGNVNSSAAKPCSRVLLRSVLSTRKGQRLAVQQVYRSAVQWCRAGGDGVDNHESHALKLSQWILTVQPILKNAAFKH